MKGLYLITNDDEFAILYNKLERALSTGKIALLQYRRKQIQLSQQLEEIPRIAKLCANYKVPLIINDNMQLAYQFNAGVHLGQDDGSIRQARKLLGDYAIIGRTCMDGIDLAEQAFTEGADYVAFGAIYSSTSKQTQAKNIGVNIIQRCKQQFPDIPICAIGGLTVENSSVVINAGADMCAVISDVLALDVDDVAKRVEAWAALF